MGLINNFYILALGFSIFILVFIAFSIVSNRCFTKNQTLVIIFSGMVQMTLSYFEIIGWVTGLWEFGAGLTNIWDVVFECFYTSCLFFPASLIVGTSYMFLKKYHFFKHFFWVPYVVYVSIGWYVDIFPGHYSNPILVLLLWLTTATVYLICFIKFSKIILS